jgi:tetratricopeptide (TPR) repeat protein
MTKPPGVWIWALIFCWLAMFLASEAGAARHRSHRHSQKDQKAKEAAKETTEAAPPEPQFPAAEKPEALLALAHEQETTADIPGALKTLSRFVNLYPRHPERGGALFRMAQLARENQQPQQAIPLYALAANLYPDSRMAGEARWQVLNLEFYQELQKSDSLAAFRNYLQRIVPLPVGVESQKLREPLLKGWQVVERAVRQKSPCPVSLVEEALALWELHPEGARPPEAALLLGELLQGKGLYGEARGYLNLALAEGSPQVRTQALVGLLEEAWASKDLPAFAGAWMLWCRNRGELTPSLKSRLAKLPLPEGFFAQAPPPGQKGKAEGKVAHKAESKPEGKPEVDAVAALLDWWNGKAIDGPRQAALIGCLEHFLSRSLPPGVKERLQLQLAYLNWSQGKFAQAAKIYKQLLAAGGRGGNAAFYQDRLALAQLNGRRPDAALQIYRDLGQGKDGFWQLLSRTRMADVELRRLEMEPSQ